MPELPEVETTLRGIKPHIAQQVIEDVIVRHYGLRWPIVRDIKKKLQGQKVQSLERRGKYLLLELTQGYVIIHLGMSGSLRILPEPTAANKHDHVDVIFSNAYTLRLTDPRRFGAFIWTNAAPHLHVLLKDLGPEPLSKNFTGPYLLKKSQNKKLPIKTFIMNSKVVVGVGNIYANEALFAAGIHPNRSAGNLSHIDCENLCMAIKNILQRAIKRGGTTLKDFLNSDGKPGYFANQLAVYGREGLPCLKCQTILTATRLGQRSTVFCQVCQTIPILPGDAKFKH